MKATWNGAVLAESNRTIEIEGNHYFPPDALHKQYFLDSTKETVCVWKGTANYFDIYANGQVNREAAWVYRTPKDAAKQITGYVAFWHGVEITP